MPPTKSICIPHRHRHPDYDDYDEYEYEEITVLTFEETEEDGTDEAAGIASGEEYFYYEEVTIADEETVVTKHDAGTVADSRYEAIVDDYHLDGPSPPLPRAAPGYHHHHGSIGDNDEFSRMDESVLFRRAMEEHEARGMLPTTTTTTMAAAPTKLGRMASSSSSVAFSYANVGRRYDFVQILDDDDDDNGIDDHPTGSRRQPQCWNEWQTLASQTLFVEEEDDDDDDQEEEDDEEASPVPSPAPAAGAAPVRDIYWEPPIKSVGWRWCGVGGGGGEAATASSSLSSPPRSRGRRRYFGFVLFRRRKGPPPSTEVEPQFLRIFANKRTN
jgi:hypothetical protein